MNYTEQARLHLLDMIAQESPTSCAESKRAQSSGIDISRVISKLVSDSEIIWYIFQTFFLSCSGKWKETQPNAIKFNLY